MTIFRGKYKNTFPFIPYGGMRKILIEDKKGDEIYLVAHFERLNSEWKKNDVHIGDDLEINYINERKFFVKKMR